MWLERCEPQLDVVLGTKDDDKLHLHIVILDQRQGKSEKDDSQRMIGSCITNISTHTHTHTHTDRPMTKKSARKTGQINAATVDSQ